ARRDVQNERNGEGGVGDDDAVRRYFEGELGAVLPHPARLIMLRRVFAARSLTHSLGDLGSLGGRDLIEDRTASYLEYVAVSEQTNVGRVGVQKNAVPRKADGHRRFFEESLKPGVDFGRSRRITLFVHGGKTLPSRRSR